MTNDIKCYIEKKYKIDHSHVNEKFKSKFATLGNLFEGKPICAWCITRLGIVADAYGNHQRGTIIGGTNVEAKTPLQDMIDKSPLKPVFADIDLSEVKRALDHHVFELEPQKPLQPSIESEMKRISGIRMVR